MDHKCLKLYNTWNHFIPSMDLLYIQRGADGFRHVPVPKNDFYGLWTVINEYVALFITWLSNCSETVNINIFKSDTITHL